jgi:predicted nuclease with TOPRIM domain
MRLQANSSQRFYQDKERLLKDQLQQQDYQIQFLKEKVAKLDVGSSNEIKQLTRKNEHLSQKLAQRENHVEALEVQLSELREQVHLVQ